MSASAADSEIASSWPCSRPELRVRSKTNCTGLRAPAEADLDARALERAARRRVVDVAERDARPADVAGVGGGQQADAEDLRGLGQRGLVAGQVERGAGDELPERLDPGPPLAVLGQPAAERALVVARVGRVDA